MRWATTSFKVSAWNKELSDALKAWAEHIRTAHPKVTEVRCYRFDGGTSIIWQEGFRDFNDYQALMEQEDDVCATVMGAVFSHMVPGTREGKIWADGI
jgi:hypothetical protein